MNSSDHFCMMFAAEEGRTEGMKEWTGVQECGWDWDSTTEQEGHTVSDQQPHYWKLGPDIYMWISESLQAQVFIQIRLK